MDNNLRNTTTGLVQAILRLTYQERQSLNAQFVCQYIYCKLSTEDHDNANETCYVTTTKLYLNDDGRQQKNLHCISIIKYITLYIYPFLIFVGIFGNGLSCLIMFLNVRRNGYSANLYLALLALVDCLFLLGSALPYWISQIDHRLDIKILSDLCCRFVYWFGNFVTHLSVGLVVTITVERFIAIRHPLIAHKFNTVKHTHIVLITLISFFFLLDSRIFILVRHLSESIHIVSTCPNDTYITYERYDTFRCGIAKKNNKHEWVFIDFAVYTLIPFLIIITLNSLIIRRLIDAQHIRKHMFHLKSKSVKYQRNSFYRNPSENEEFLAEQHPWVRRSRSVPTTVLTQIMFHSQTNRIDLRSNLNPSIESSLENRIRPHDPYENSLIRQTTSTNNMRLTILLLFVSCSFLILTLPAVVINLAMSTALKTKSLDLQDELISIDGDQNSDTNCYYTIARLLMIVNHSINFILYFVVGKRFRRDLKNLFVKHWRK